MKMKTIELRDRIIQGLKDVTDATATVKIDGNCFSAADFAIVMDGSIDIYSIVVIKHWNELE